jgi:hypothetical protein
MVVLQCEEPRYVLVPAELEMPKPSAFRLWKCGY